MAEAQQQKSSHVAAILGWGGLAVFAIGFVAIVIGQLQDTQEWGNRGKEAVEIVRMYKPDGKPETLDDLLKAYSLKAKEKGGYVGEFSWDAKQKEGPEYEVQLLWKDGDNAKTALWRVDLKQKDVRPQGEAGTLPQRARDGVFGG
jgi:hypothetical protein